MENILTNLLCFFYSGGSGRTGTYIAISILLDRLKVEGVVDVFQTVRGLRLQRMLMVQTLVRTNTSSLLLTCTYVIFCVSFVFRHSMNSVTLLYWNFWIPLNYILTLNN